MPTIDELEIKVSSQSTEAAKGIDTLTAALRKLKTATQGGSGLKNTSNQLPQLSEKIKTLASNISKVTSAVVAAKRVGSVIGGWIKESNDYVENLNLFTVSMGQYADEAKNYAEIVGDAMGIDPSKWMRYQGVFMTLATGFGIAGDRAAVMSKNLTQLSYDISSFYNKSFEESMNAIRSGFSGEIEPVRNLGYDLSQAKLQAIALENGITKSYSAMTQAEKSQLRYIALMTQVTQVQGDMARTLNAPANQLRVLSASATQAARALGNIFIPMLNKILPYATAAMKAIRRLADRIANLFGFEIQEVDYSGISGAAASASDVSDTVDDATKSVKKFKNELLGIDEINILGSQQDSSSAGDLSSLGGEVQFSLPEYDFLSGLVESKTEAITDAIETALDNIASILAAAPLVIGAVLTFTGHPAIGIPLMIAGAAGLAISAALDYKYTEDKVKSVLDSIAKILSASLLAAGAVLAFTGANVPIGVALMVVGATALATSVALNWNGISDNVKAVISVIAGIVGAAFLVLGAILTFGWINPPIGIALLAAGASMLISAVAANWDWLKDNIKSILAAIFSIVSVATLVLGVLLLFSGAGIPLGLGLIAAGAKGITAAAAWDDNVVTKKISGAFDKARKSIETWWNNLKSWWKNLTLPEFKVKKLKLSWTAQDIDSGDWKYKILSALGLPVQIPKLNVTWYAGGGYPSVGELFVAREAGPEMVGTIGGRSAVVNNEQIIASLEGGVERGFIKAMSAGFGGDITIIIQTSDGDIIQKIKRANAKAGKILVPVDL
ncbi:MAG: UbiA family prenyltransferase [Acutalibacteraceae bacterium]